MKKRRGGHIKKIVLKVFLLLLFHSNYQEIVAHYFTHNLLNNCYVIQPWIKWGFRKMQDTTPEYQLEEAASLIRTLAPWRVYDR